MINFIVLMVYNGNPKFGKNFLAEKRMVVVELVLYRTQDQLNIIVSPRMINFIVLMVYNGNSKFGKSF